jgi:hypothetical protein
MFEMAMSSLHENDLIPRFRLTLCLSFLHSSSESEFVVFPAGNVIDLTGDETEVTALVDHIGVLTENLASVNIGNALASVVVISPISPEDLTFIRNVMDVGEDKDILTKTHDEYIDSVQRSSFRTLRPSVWLNDEVLHSFFTTLQRRDIQLCQEQQGRMRTHFFKSFFMKKLLNEGNECPDLDGLYCYENVKKWSQKVPGTLLSE